MLETAEQKLARVAWTQSIISHRIVPASFAKHLYERCCTILHSSYNESTYLSMYDEAARHLSVISFELRTFKDQSTGVTMLALINTKADTFIRGATRYTANGISYIRKLVEEIFRAKREAYSIASMEAVRLGGKVRQHLTRDATEELLKNLVDHRWLDYSADGIYTLSTRTLLELRNYLQSEFEEHYHACTHCKDVVTLGIGCSYASRGGCDVRFHYHCARATIGAKVDDDDALHRLGGICVGCRKNWKSRPIGPRALGLTGGEEGWVSSQGEASQEASGSGRRRRQEEEDEEDEEDEEEGNASPVERPRRPVKRQASEEDEDEDEEDEEEEADTTARRPGWVKPEPQHTPQASRSRHRPTEQEEEEDEDEDEEVDVKLRKRAR
ncbi:Zinc finger, RING-like protein [Kalmanozyma brasiliensis GHG001]|uniref:Non-structural maintenance of chromosomes element 1 homolog n=1 Tax=Kalmanozyma brasiliensis (strain GHG001) TaxID=1365824 RepID=V5EE85_KALBG|nr:Zinc finger, RING-like protein [Kalmanozyma brasiliensis GHG001]EST08801.1 Zinc finger, RING-like protein [Kalmanozyma brasiliensis GHG001]